MSLCPEELETAENCTKRFCHYRSKKGKCSLDFEPEDREYSVEEISEAIQTSRQRVWRLYDVALAKLKNRLSND
jgi:hypothetical protein